VGEKTWDEYKKYDLGVYLDGTLNSMILEKLGALNK
jgi:hypothetical protein